jgi:hypothetical protein
MTRRSPGMELGLVNIVLVAGTLAVSVLGTELVAQQETAGRPQDTTSVTVITIPAGDREERFELPPVPKAISPGLRPVARSRSSR